MVKISAEKLEKISVAIFKGAGCSDDEAERVSELLVLANLRGHDSHGVVRIPSYIGQILVGQMKPGAEIEVVKENNVMAVLNGNLGIGQIMATRGMEIAIEKAKKTGVGIVSIYNCNHIGRMADYAIMALKHDMIGFVTANVGPTTMVAPYGGAKGALGTNPLCYAIPTGNDEPIILDIATSVCAAGKVRVAHARGEQVPKGWLIDNKGHSTTDPSVIYDSPPGSILPFGGEVAYKGYGLCLIVDILSGALSSSGCGSKAHTNGVFLMALNISNFRPIREFENSVRKLVSECKSTPFAPGFVGIHGETEVLIPGDIERMKEEKNRKTGIFVEETTWNRILKAAKDVSVDLDKL